MAKKQYLSLSGLETYDEQIKAYVDGVKNNVQPKDFVATITSKFENNSIVYTCDTSSADLWAAHEAGRNVIFNIGNTLFSNAEFVISASQSDSEVKQVRLMFLNGATAQLYVVHEDDSVNVTNYSFLTTANVKQETGTDRKNPMSQKAVTNALASKSDASHTHDDIYYTEAEIDTKLSAVNTSISNITSGTTPVKEAEHATSADSATNATHATSADSATSATSATKATQDGNGKEISSTYETKDDATAKLAEAKSHADSAASTAATAVKNDLLNGAGAAYDTLKELGDLIDENVSAIDALEAVAANKKDKDFIVQISGNETDGYVADKTFDEIVEAANNGSTLYAITSSMAKYEFNRASNTNAWFNSYTPNNMMYKTITIKSDNTVSLTSQSMAATQYFYGGVKAVAKTDTDTVEAKIGTDGKLYVPTYPSLDEYYTESEIDGMIASKADASHNHAIADVTNLQSTLDGKANQSALDGVSTVANEAKTAAASNTQAISANISAINAHTDRITSLETLVGDGFEEITEQEIKNLFSA